MLVNRELLQLRQGLEALAEGRHVHELAAAAEVHPLGDNDAFALGLPHACLSAVSNAEEAGRRLLLRQVLAAMAGPACTPSTLVASICLVFGGLWWDNTHNNTIIGKFAHFQNHSTPELGETAVPMQGEGEGGLPQQPAPETQPDSLEDPAEEAPAPQHAEEGQPPDATLAPQEAEQPRSQESVQADRNYQKELQEKERLDPAAIEQLEKEQAAALAAVKPPA